MSIKAKLFVFVLGIFVLGVGGTAYWNEVQVEKAVLEILKGRQKEGALLAAKSMQQAISRLQYIIDELSYGDHTRNVLKDPKNPDFVSNANARLRRVQELLPEVSVMGIIDTKGLVAASSNKEAPGTMNLGDRGYFKDAMQGKSVISEPSKSRTTGKPAVMIAAPVKENNAIIGVTYLTVDLEHVFKDVAAIKSGNNGYAFVVDKNGIMLYHPDSKRIFAETRKEDWAAPLWKGGPEGYFECDFAGSRWLVNYYTMPDTGWIVMLNAEDTDLLTSLLAIRNQTVSVNIVLFLIITCTVWLFARSLGRAFDQGIAFARRVEEGDFAARWNNHKKDELGKLAASLNVAFDKVANQAVWYESLLNAIKAPIAVMDLDEKLTFVNAAFNDLADKKAISLIGKPCAGLGMGICGTQDCAIRCMQRGKESTRVQKNGKLLDVFVYHLNDKDQKHIGYIEVLNDITAQEALKEQAAQAALQGRLDAANQLEAVVNIISSASTQLSAQIEQSERGATEQAARVTETATAMNEMNATVLEVANNASSASDMSVTTRTKALSGAEVVQQAVNGIRSVQKQSVALKDDMVTLSENAQSINQIMGVISDIADQTNLLALNAAIEAARAGEAGRGFAVVADEVRKLAEKTMQSTTDVGNAIRAIQNSAAKSVAQVDETVTTIETATELAGRSGEALTEIVRMVDNTADQVRAIATAAEQQSASSEEINHSITQVNGIATETAHTMGQAARAVEELSAQAQVLTRLIEDMKK